ncbi:hypothetical protein GCM10009867_05190 [Pedococcus aerophilus]|uniref:Class F sortase n=1 Tax=Pedococcus aerophilus TaxID=436356 RepID=A0ABP6GVF7_9MICO|nr:class F sortase [Phycicoccus sp. Root101]KQU69686.1 hypothetical protein ASC58_20300 [Phycicoccus sp. Root101]
MSASSEFGDRRGSIAAAVTVVLLVVGGVLVAKSLTGSDAPPQPDASQAEATTSAPSTQPPTSTQTPTSSEAATKSQAPATPQSSSDFGPILEPSAPTSLTIPSIGVRTRGIVDLGLDKNGRLEAPTDFDRAGWYANGPTPGEFGPAVIGAHVDSKAGPAVFYRLGSLKKGATLSVGREDGSTARFLVDRVARYSKADFPTSTVYGDTGGRAELRLITCGGAFDQATGHYVDNIVAFAHLVR